MLGIAFLVLILPVLRGVRIRVDELLILGLTALLAIRHARMVFVFGLIAAPVLCRLLSGEWEKYELRRDRIFPNLVFISISLLVVLFSFPNTSVLTRDVEDSNPAKAMKFIRQSGLKGNMLNDYTFGGYLIWSAPERKVFVDGRGDVFEWTGVLADYNNFFTLAVDPGVLLSKYNITTCLLSKQTPMSRVLTQWLGWKVAYSDSVAEVLVRKAPSDK